MLNPRYSASAELKTDSGSSILFVSTDETLSAKLLPFLKGDKGDTGDAAALSTDEGNRATLGSDSKVFVPDLVSDPLAYYILAKS